MEHTLPKVKAATIQARASAIAAVAKQDKALKGFDPVSLITLLISLIPALAKCFNPSPAPTPAPVAGAQAKKYVNAQYDPATGKYEDHLTNRVALQVLLKASGMHLVTSKDQRRVIGNKVLDDLRTQPDAVVGAVMAEASQAG